MSKARSDVVESYLKSYVEPLGSLVINYAKAEAALLELFVAMSGHSVRDAYKVIHSGEISERERSVYSHLSKTKLLDFDKEELRNGLHNFWIARESRHRLIHDDWVPSWDEHEGLVVALYGRSKKNPDKTIIDNPHVDDLWDLAEVFQTCGLMFDHYAYALTNKCDE